MISDDRDKSSSATKTALAVSPSTAGFIVKVGTVFFVLEREAAEELMFLLAEALEAGDPIDIATGGSN